VPAERKTHKGTGRLRSASIRDEITRRIADGRLPIGTRLPSEPELAAELGVSRATLREALQSLATDGLVHRRRGSGTFVLERPRMATNLDLNYGITAAIRAAGMRPGTREAGYRTEPATADDAAKLGVAAGTNLLVIDRVRTADDQPVVVSRDIFVRDRLDDLEHVVDRMLKGSIYDVIQNDMGVVVDHGVATLSPIRADSQLAEKLDVRNGELLIYLWQVDYTSEGIPVLLSHEYHRADVFDFSIIRRGPERRPT
jgi:GntR family transcriptional regulator